MVDRETFLVRVYVSVDDFTKGLVLEAHPGPDPSLSRSEVITLGLLSQWGRFSSQRAFYRYAKSHLLSAFPSLPDRSQFNRLMRRYRDDIAYFALHLADILGINSSPYQVIDGLGVRTRDFRRRGKGHLAGQANIGWSNRLRWYCGFRLLTCVSKEGVVTGFGFAPASTNDRMLAESFFGARATPNPLLPTVGDRSACPYLADKGFAGKHWQHHWLADYLALAICSPEMNITHPWPKALRRYHASLRQIVETVHDKLMNVFRLDRERPHSLDGFQARLASTMALHNFCIWLNRQLGRRPLAFVDLLDW